MTAATVVLVGDTQRAFAKRLIDNAPAGHVVMLKAPTRNLEQNAKLHAAIDDVVNADPLGHGYGKDDYKTLFVFAFKKELRLLYGLNGELVPAGRQTSKMGVHEMADFITFVEAWGTQNGVTWTEPQEMAA
jgi:hypothetical protein